jgi:hypothetical protein
MIPRLFCGLLLPACPLLTMVLQKNLLFMHLYCCCRTLVAGTGLAFCAYAGWKLDSSRGFPQTTTKLNVWVTEQDIIREGQTV